MSETIQGGYITTPKNLSQFMCIYSSIGRAGASKTLGYGFESH